MWWMLFPRWIWFFLLFLVSVSSFSVSRVENSHDGMCPNELNPNLWVDAMSTCTRECLSDQDCETFEKCCANVCGSHSCVSSRSKMSPGQIGAEASMSEASCEAFPCSQQGSHCELWDRQQVCVCRERCEREPSFTCASDGMTYYNPCFMEAEACSKGISLSVVPCGIHQYLSPSPRATTAVLTTATPYLTAPLVIVPVITSSVLHQEVIVGATASFPCEATGRPTPELSWKKQSSDGVRMRPNHMHGNAVITNIGQLVIYNTQLEDSGVYVCTASNTGGSTSAQFSLSVLEPDPAPKGNASGVPLEECWKPPDVENCTGETLSWFYDAKRNNCFTFSSGNCSRNQNCFDDYESCMVSCQVLAAPCTLPVIQGPCRSYEPRWAWSGTRCQLFIYSGCRGNENNFRSREACEDICPFPRAHRCSPCRPRNKMASSFFQSDFVILGQMLQGSGDQALVAVEEILKDEKMGLRFLGKEMLEVTLLNPDQSCPCPNITSAERLIIMGEVRNGMAVLTPDSFIVASSARRVRKLQEIVSKNTYEILRELTQQDEA